ncbi:DoxX family protein [Fulvivirga sp. M361]|uniref:DoxX family protein n=1 Tax=Fulvivirga sp. M361 TaxID=2594266 RepID=UPI001179D918|nr:DoxX family protein [Fulvivirga sp. M361]TRX62648.1 DoxX family protein [Fulvivirga sp. M361]
MTEKTKKIIGWVLSGLLGALLLFSAMGKFMGQASPMMEHFGFTASETTLIAIGEVISAVLFLIPRTQSLGTLLVTAYMGGAIASHMSAAAGTEELGGEGIQNYLMPSIILVLVWVASLLRNPKTLSSFSG